jgi:acetate kinase
MGMSPQSGLLNAKRTGDFDSFALLYVMEKEGLSPEKAREILISRSGVFGLSGGSADFRDVIAKMWKGDRHAESAFKTFAYYVKRYIGEYIAVLDMPDLIVFTGGLGQNSPEMREASAGGMENLGIVLDEERNRTNPVEGLISTPESKIKVAVMQTNEELIVAEAVRGYMKEKRKIGIRG